MARKRSTRFVQTHLANSHKKQAVLLNYCYLKSMTQKYIEVHDTHHHDFVKLYLPSQFSDRAFINACDGLVCLSNLESSIIHIWNPSTKRLKLLPPPKKQLSRWYVPIGLGFDHISNDYKLLRISYKVQQDYTYAVEPELYSANSDSWKDIQIPKQLQQPSWSDMSKVVPAKSGLYMAILRELIAFDLHNEEFHLYPFPICEQYYHAMSEVLDFEGSVAMIFEKSNGSALSLYRLDDVCGKGSWTKMFNLEADIKIDWVHHYLGLGQFIAYNYADGCVFNYDYKKGGTKKCGLKLNLDIKMGYPVKYVESLVSINGFERL
ncbi:hypothetical protein POM88_023435 [Heracleum sosnowskyi]|uniref:F-box associated beta-propeller type 3 domain-containing protein n=1 Tax=Heracleum sosnowskyi TaxID=360622 RepID=A0AAD8IHA4_9APIA|nr:hypothetical protein POM88_023435 [Heracleum sosnowskyi]